MNMYAGSRAVSRQHHRSVRPDDQFVTFSQVFYSQQKQEGGSSMPVFCQCGCGRRVARKGVLTKLCSRKGHTSIAVKGMTKGQLRRLTDPDGLHEKYKCTPREMNNKRVDRGALKNAN